LSSMNEGKKDKPCFVFDFGGVVFDWSPYYLFDRYFENKEAVDRFLKEIDFAAWNVQQDVGYPFDRAVADKVALFPHYEQALRAYDAEWMVMFGGAIQGTVEIIKELKQAGYPLYALSNWSVTKFADIRASHDFLKLFEIIVLSGEEKIAKPDARLYQILLERAGRQAGECIFIDDVEKNLAGARVLGFGTIRFESPEQLRAELVDQGYLE
jgi:2-haloacid dehalogenase